MHRKTWSFKAGIYGAVSHLTWCLLLLNVLPSDGYPAALALRKMALVHDDLPKYLLAPEVNGLLHYVPDLHRRMMLATLWNTGAH